MKFPALILILVTLPVSAANWYLNSVSGSDANSGATWALAKATLTNTLALMAAGDNCYVTNAHSESFAASMTLTSLGTAANPCKIIVCSDSAEPPVIVSSGATFATTGGTTISFAGFAYCYGFIFKSADGGNNGGINFVSTVPWWWSLDTCSLRLNGTGSSGLIAIGNNASTADDQFLQLNNTTLSFGNVNQGIAARARFSWQNTGSAIIATIPTPLFQAFNGVPATGVIIGVDLSALGAGKTLVSMSSVSAHNFYFQECKLGDSVSLTSGSVAGQGGTEIRFVNCDSGTQNYRYYKQTYAGTISTETTNIRTNGATDLGTPVSRKLVSTANSAFIFPLASDPVTFWVDATNVSQTITIPILTTNLTLTSSDVWVDVDYLGSSATPISSRASSRTKDILTASTNLLTDSTSIWNTNGLPAATKTKISVSFTPQMKGLVKTTVNLAKPSVTVYFDPLSYIGIRQYQNGPVYANEGRVEHSSVFGQ